MALDQASDYRELTAALKAQAADLLATPTMMARGLDPKFVVRPYGRIIGDAMAELLAGTTYKRLMIVLPTQVGKPVYAGSMILMGDGSRKRIDQIEPGDEVITHLGRPRRVLAVHRQGVLPTVKIKTFAGRETVAALDHPFLTPEGWVNAGDLTEGTALANVSGPATVPADGGLRPEEARLMGAFIGDGSVTSTGTGTAMNCAITVYDEGSRAELIRCAETLGYTARDSLGVKGGRLNFSGGGVRDWLRGHGLAYKTAQTKRVPAAVFTSSPEVIAEFIGGYWDCDGTVTSRGKDRTGVLRKDVSVELYSVSKGLLEDVQHLLLRLGIVAHLRDKIVQYNGKPHQSYRLYIISRNDLWRFKSLIRLTHTKRAAMLAAHGLPLIEFPRPLIPDVVVSVDSGGDRECLCLTVEDDHTFTSDDLIVHNSTLVNEWGSFWWLANRPEARIISTSYGDDLARGRGMKVRDLVAEHGYLYDLQHTMARPSARHWTMRSGGGMRSVSMGRTITGFPADLMIIDDPFKDRADAESHARREAVWDWYSSTGSQRLQPDSPIIVINTRWHVEDLSGRLLQRDGKWEDGGKWKILHFPAVADPKFGPDPLGRAPGGLLPHHAIKLRDTARLSRYWRDKKAEQTVRDWAAMAQGDPQPVKGALVSYDLLRSLRIYDPAEMATAVKHAVAIDPSGGGRDAAGIIGGHLGDDGRMFITHDRSGVGGSDEWSVWACELAAEIGADSFVIESNYGGDMAAQMLKLAWEKLGRDHTERQAELVLAALAEERTYTPEPNPYPMTGIPRLVQVTAKKGKTLRAELLAQQMVMDKVRLLHPLMDMEQEWATWMPTDPLSPGRIDASVYLGFALLRIAGAARVISVAGTKRDGASGRGQTGGRRIER